MAVIETHGLTKDFGAGRGILDLDLRVEAGRIHGFLGPNGAGKTTTIRLLLDLLRPTRGRARVLGLDPWGESKAVRRKLGYIPGELALPGHLSGRRYLADSARVRGDVDEDWQSWLAKTLRADLDLKMRKLSKGNRQKVAIVDALQHRPPLLVLDEPTDGLDPVLRRIVHELLRRHARAGGTVFLSSHVVHEIQNVCDDVSIVLAGRLRRQARIDDLLAAEPVHVEATLDPTPAARARLLGVPGVKGLRKRGDRVAFEVDGSLLAAMQALIDLDAKDVTARHDLEDTFLRLYSEVAS